MNDSPAALPSEDAPDATNMTSEIFPFSAEVRRKLLHIAALILPAGVAVLGRTTALAVLVPGALLAVGADVLRSRSAAFSRLIRRIFGAMMRPDELPPVGGRVIFNGATWMVLSVTLMTALFPARIAVPALVMFMLADAMAALVGRTWGRTPWGFQGRTVEGSLAFVATGLAVMACFPLTWGVGAAGVLVGAAAEILPRPLNDNLRVPLATGAALVLLEWLL